LNKNKKLKPCPPRLLNKYIKEVSKPKNREVILLLWIVECLKERGYHI